MTNIAQINIDPKSFGKWAGRRRLCDEDSATHALVTELFGRQTFQPFRYREISGRGGILNGYTEASAEELRDMVALSAGPEGEALLDGDILTKPMYLPSKGQRVGFEIKVTPVVRTGQARVERDVYMRDLALGLKTDRDMSYAKWLAQRLEPASTIEAFRLVRHKTYKSKRKKNSVTVNSAVIQGTLTVRFEDAFHTLMKNGVGRQKAYGFGMLALTAPDRA